MANDSAPGANNITVELDGVEGSTFDLPSGFRETVEERHDSKSGQIMKQAHGRVNVEDIVLSRPFTGKNDLFNLVEDHKKGEGKSISGSALVKDAAGKTLAKFTLEEVWCREWQLLSMTNAQGAPEAREQITINVTNLMMG